MSNFKPGDIVYYMDGDTLCQGILCMTEDFYQLPATHEEFCVVYTISPECGSRAWGLHEERSLCCDRLHVDELYSSPDELINHIKETLKHEYDKKIKVLDAYVKGTTKEKQTLAGKVKEIILGYNVEDQ